MMIDKRHEELQELVRQTVAKHAARKQRPVVSQCVLQTCKNALNILNLNNWISKYLWYEKLTSGALQLLQEHGAAGECLSVAQHEGRQRPDHVSTSEKPEVFTV